LPVANNPRYPKTRSIASEKLNDEVTFRLNDGNVTIHTLDRLDSFIAAVDGKRLTYERLTA
jgi:hypothetical protein